MPADTMSQGVHRRVRGNRPTAAPTPALAGRLPELPQSAQERAEALADLASAFVAQHGPTTAQALASWLDEAATEVADDAERR